MLDFIEGIIAIVLVLVILLMRESDNKWVAYIGMGVIILAKIYANIN